MAQAASRLLSVVSADIAVLLASGLISVTSLLWPRGGVCLSGFYLYL